MADAQIAIDGVLAKEGGYVHHPDDPGGETNFGISKRRYPEVDIAGLTREAAAALYRRDFWNPLYEQLEQPLADKVLDVTVNMSHGDQRPYYETDMVGIRLLQRALRALGHRELAVDGRFGPQASVAARLDAAPAVLAAFRVEIVRYYLSLADEKAHLRTFFRGWVRRALASIALLLLLAAPAIAYEPVTPEGRAVRDLGWKGGACPCACPR